MTAPGRVDRAAAIRQSLLELVAEQGLHATSMSDLARRAGVAAGTIYVHYADKDALIRAVYAEVKRDLAMAASANWATADSAEGRFLAAWHGVLQHLSERPERARFLLQIEASPYAGGSVDDEVSAAWSQMIADLGDLLADLPHDVLYGLAFGPAVTLAARSAKPADETSLTTLALACWRAITKER